MRPPAPVTGDRPTQAPPTDQVSKQPPAPPPQRKLVDGYGAGGFKIAGERVKGSLLITSLATWSWPIEDPSQATIESLEILLVADPGLELLLFGTGQRMAPPMPADAIWGRARWRCCCSGWADAPPSTSC